MGRLDGKVCVITGAGGGMGRDAAELFTQEGAKVCAADVNLELGLLSADEHDRIVVAARDVAEGRLADEFPLYDGLTSPGSWR